MTHNTGLRIQLWSYNFDPEPTGIGVVSTVWARGLRDRGHDVKVIAAHPHYPEPVWGTRWRPYRETRNGIDVIRLPLWVGRASTSERYRQELSFMASQLAVAPLLPKPDILVSASPSFPALLPAMLKTRASDTPWVLWLHDLLPDGATATGLVNEGGAVIKLARKLERAAYAAADRIIVLSRAFTPNLVAKGVPPGKIELIYDPATRQPAHRTLGPAPEGPLKLLSMGNIGHSQGLTALVQAFEAHPDLTADATFAITGTGVAAAEAAAEIRSKRVHMLGMLNDEDLESQLHEADIAFVSQRYEGSEFNIPSKLMNFMAYGLPVLAAVNPAGEVARLVREANAGWVVDSSQPGSFATTVARLDQSRDEIRDKARNSKLYAEEHFTQSGFAERFERTLREVVESRSRSVSPSTSV